MRMPYLNAALDPDNFHQGLACFNITRMKRLGFDGRMRAYFDVHAALDVSHAREWIREIIEPLVHADPGCAIFIAEGAMMRLVCGELCFERYTKQLCPEVSVPMELAAC